MSTKTSRIDKQPNFLSYGAPFTCAWCFAAKCFDLISNTPNKILIAYQQAHLCEFGKNFGGRTFPRAMADPPPKYSAIFLLISCSLVRSRGNVFQNLAPLNLKEPWYLVVLASGRGSKSLWRVLYEWKSREWLNSLNKCAGACSGYIFLIRKCSENSLENLLQSISRIRVKHVILPLSNSTSK